MRTLLVVVAAVVLVGCSKKDGGATDAGTATGRGGSDRGNPAQTVPVEPGHTAPAILRLSANAAPGATDATLTAEIEILVPSDTPATLRIALPAGASLAKGTAQESIDMRSKTTLHREFRVHGSAPLVDTAPVHVVLEAQSPDGKSGFRADRAWPPKQTASAPPRASGPRPPGGRPPLPAEPTAEPTAEPAASDSPTTGQ